ncbi:MAG: response regulator transcription factor [Bacteroidia bacterium]
MKTRVLYVEDESSLGKIVTESMEHRSFEILWRKNGLQILDDISTFDPEVCVLDVMLPGKNGFTLGKEIRERYPDLPIIFLTAKDQTQDLVEGFNSGGTDYIRKPFSIDELIVRINNQISLGSRKSDKDLVNEKIQLLSYTFHPLTSELHFGDETFSLSNRESQLLALFARQRNQTISRKSILLSIWGDDSFFNSRNLDVYVRKLREYFRHDERIKIITLKGEGYRFVV